MTRPAPRKGSGAWTAAGIAARVRAGELSPVEAVRESLSRIAARDGRLGAFQRVRGTEALAEAEALEARGELGRLALAGVPVAVKDNRAVAGEPTRRGSLATPAAPAAEDHPLVRRLRAAGAIIVGKTRLPELGVWGTTDSSFGVTRNPWDPERTAGGSSGGSAAAVAAGMVPVAHGNDGLGSIRIPAAACGLFGLKPGSAVVPGRAGGHRDDGDDGGGWHGLVEDGPIATTVADGALLLSVLAERSELASVSGPDRPLRVALSLRSPIPGVRVAAEWREAAVETARSLEAEGHRVEEADPPYATRFALAIVARWLSGAAREARGLDPDLLEPRTRRHAALGRWVDRIGGVRDRDRQRWRARSAEFFREHDVLLTPTLARAPIPAGPWHTRPWTANLAANTRFAPLTGPWNLAGLPAAAVPAGSDGEGLPLSVQLVVPAGGEGLVLSVARELERIRPWPRHAPVAPSPRTPVGEDAP